MQGNAHDEEYDDPHGQCLHEITRLRETLAQSQAREGELREALKPFAGLPETSEAETAVPNNSPVTIRCELGDVRRARSALSPPKEKT